MPASLRLKAYSDSVVRIRPIAVQARRRELSGREQLRDHLGPGESGDPIDQSTGNGSRRGTHQKPRVVSNCYWSQGIAA